MDWTSLGYFLATVLQYDIPLIIVILFLPFVSFIVKTNGINYQAIITEYSQDKYFLVQTLEHVYESEISYYQSELQNLRQNQYK